MGFEPTITASERTKTVHASDLATNVTGFILIQLELIHETASSHLVQWVSVRIQKIISITYFVN
jgi:hypothetical protein